MPVTPDPASILESLQDLMHAQWPLPFLRGRVDPQLRLLVDDLPCGHTRYALLKCEGSGICGLAIFAGAAPRRAVPCFDLTYAVPPERRNKGEARALLRAALAEFQYRLARRGIGAVDIVAHVPAHLAAAQAVAAREISPISEVVWDQAGNVTGRRYIRQTFTAAAAVARYAPDGPLARSPVEALDRITAMARLRATLAG